MTPAQALVSQLTASGVMLWLDGESIVHRGPRLVLNPTVLARLRQHKAEVIIELKARIKRAIPACPADISERAALMEEGDHCGRVVSESRALAEQGFVSWSSLADAHRRHIITRLDTMPPPLSKQGHLLSDFTRAFLDTDHWHSAVRLGWDIVELFGIHAIAPLVRVDAQGLVTGMSLSKLLGAEIVAIAESHASVRCRSGSILTYKRSAPGLDTAVLWWDCSSITEGINDA